jgi:hypothetical protein
MGLFTLISNQLSSFARIIILSTLYTTHSLTIYGITVVASLVFIVQLFVALVQYGYCSHMV